MKKLAIVVILFITTKSIVYSQNIWLKDTSSSVSIEFLKPIFDAGLTVLTSGNYLSWKQKLSNRVFLNLSIPFAYAKMDESGMDGEFAFGNLFIGSEIKITKESWVETGIHFPTTSDEKFESTFVGLYADLNRLESFSVDNLTIPLIFNLAQLKNGFYYRLRFGPKFLINTGDSFNDDLEILLDYCTQAGYSMKKFSAILGLSGSFITTEDLDFDEATYHQLGIGLYTSLGKFTPGITIRKLLDKDFKDFIDFTLGISLTYNL